MGANEASKQDPEQPDPMELVHYESPYPNPIVVREGGGLCVRLPVSEAVVQRLGGSSQVRERLAEILSSEQYLSGEISPPAAATLAAQYGKFFQQFETMTADRSPIRTNPKGGWSITVPIPEMVVERLGGSSRLRERLAAVYASEPDVSAEDSPHAAARITAHYEKLIGQMETIIKEPER